MAAEQMDPHRKREREREKEKTCRKWRRIFFFMRKQAKQALEQCEWLRPGTLWRRATANMQFGGGPRWHACMYASDSQSLDASNNGVEGGLNVSGRAGGHNGLGLFMEQLGYILHRNTREPHNELMYIQKAKRNIAMHWYQHIVGFSPLLVLCKANNIRTLQSLQMSTNFNLWSYFKAINKINEFEKDLLTKPFQPVIQYNDLFKDNLTKQT